MKVSDVAAGSPAANLHPAVAGQLGLPPQTASPLNVSNDTYRQQAPPSLPNQGHGPYIGTRTPAPTPNQGSGPYIGTMPAPSRGVDLPPTSQPANSPTDTTSTYERRSDIQPGSTESSAPPVPPINTSGAPDFQHLNYADDPLLALTRQREAGADNASAADALANIQSPLLAYGSRSLAQDYFGQLANDTTFRNALGDKLWNKFQESVPGLYDQIDKNADPNTGLSTLAQLAHQAALQGHQQDESFNQNNLFFSGAHNNALSELARTQEINKYNAATAVLGQLAGARTGLLNATQQHAATLTQAESDAYNRAVDEALKYQTGASGTGGGKDKPQPDKPPPKGTPKPDPQGTTKDNKAGPKGVNPPVPKKDTRPRHPAPRPTRVH